MGKPKYLHAGSTHPQTPQPLGRKGLPREKPTEAGDQVPCVESADLLFQERVFEQRLRPQRDDDNSMKLPAFDPPRLVAETLFLDPGTPDSLWQAQVNADHFAEVYVRVPTDPTASDARAAVNFAIAVKSFIESRQDVLDPVLIGPVTPEFLAVFSQEIRKNSLGVASESEAEYSAAIR